jgi:quercetin dioxygenase-like cupin family protein
MTAQPPAGYQPSPRPTFGRATAIPYASVTRHLWGDPVAGSVADWIYVSSDRIHQLVWGVGPGGGFTHSDEFRTIFAADVIYIVLEGIMVIANPATGEVQRMLPGEAGFFRRDTWHHAWNAGTGPLRCLEFFSPPPSQGTSGSYARKQPLLERVRYDPARFLGRWPMARAEADRDRTIWPIREADLLWTMVDTINPIPAALLVSTEHLTVGRIDLLPGQTSGQDSHPGDESLHVTSGVLNVEILDGGRPNLLELHPGDGAYIPAGTPHAYHNIGGVTARFHFGVAPGHQRAGGG